MIMNQSIRVKKVRERVERKKRRERELIRKSYKSLGTSVFLWMHR